jgi:hypothetical protein
MSLFTEALERYSTIFRHGESAINDVLVELRAIRSDSTLTVSRESIEVLIAHLMIAELAFEALVNKIEQQKA